MANTVQLKAFLQRQCRSNVPSPFEGDEDVRVLAVVRTGWSFRSKLKGTCGMQFDDMKREEIERVMGKPKLLPGGNEMKYPATIKKTLKCKTTKKS